jgi:hypothetical protein
MAMASKNPAAESLAYTSTPLHMVMRFECTYDAETSNVGGRCGVWRPLL